ncbi:MAG: TolB family protein [Limisphaerales bacterium]
MNSIFAASGLAALLISATAAPIGLFESATDVGTLSRPGSLKFDAAANRYTVTGGGSNMWFGTDAFYFVWKKVSGDVSLAADIDIPASSGDPHRKGVLIIRQSLAADSAYADAALHGDGLTSLQYRPASGERTYEIQANVTRPKRLRIEKRGSYVSMSIAGAGEELRPAGGTFRLSLEEPFYIGLGVCSHNDKNLETAIFSNVELNSGVPPGKKLVSTLETITIASRDRRAVYTTTNHIEAPNWSKDNFLYYNSRGRIHKIPAAGGTPEMIDTAFATRCNNDHGISPDGTQLVISDHAEERHSLIYTLPITGGTPRRVTKLGPSYWHGWSPDGKTLVYCAERNKEFDVYSIGVNGGEETRLTTAPGLDDGPEYSPDGKLIYFNSDRTGTMQIWRMLADGSQQEQITKDEFNNWFAHPSPDGKWLVFLSYEKDVKGHPENKDVTLRIMALNNNPPSGKIEPLATLFGGQGTINVPSWSPDSRRLSFVSYQFVP